MALSLLAILIPTLALAQAPGIDLEELSAPSFVTFSERDGVPEAVAVDVRTDAEGFVWLASAHGLARYDGKAWKSDGPAAAAGTLGSLTVDHGGRLWVAFHDRGLGYWDGAHWQMADRTDGVSSTHVRRVVETFDAQGKPHLWAATFGEGVLERDAQGRWQRTAGTETLPRFVQDVAMTSRLGGHERLWASTFDGLWYRESGRWRRYETKIGNVGNIFVTGRGENEQLWATTIGQGLWRIDRRGLRHWSVESGELPSNDLYSMDAGTSRSGEAVLWVSSRAGVLRVLGDRVSAYGRNYGLPSDAVRGLSIWRSPEGIEVLWVATENGVARAVLGGRPWHTVSLLGEHGTGVFGVLPESDQAGRSRLWIAASKDGLGLYENGLWRRFSLANGSLPSDDVRMIRRTHDGAGKTTLWLGMTQGYLMQVEMPGPRFIPVKTPWPIAREQAVTDVVALSRNGVTEHWFATGIGGVFRLREGRWTRFTLDGLREEWQVRSLVAQTDKEGRNWLWAAGRQGLARHDGHVWEAHPLALPDTFLLGLNLLVDAQGRQVLWLGTLNHAIVRVDVSDPAHPLLLADDLPAAPDPTAYGAAQDSRGRIYICTNSGVQQLTPDGAAYHSRVFTHRDGLINDECNGGSQWIDAQDRYWTGTLGGAAVFDPAPQLRDQTPKPLRWLGAQLDGEKLEGEAIVMPAGRHELVAHYALLAWNHESGSRFRTQLIGFDAAPEEWTPQNSRVLANLPPGRYRLRIQARDYAGNQSPALEIPIEVIPAWWQLWWAWAVFALMAAVLLGTMAAMLWRWRMRAQRANRRILEHLVDERTAELNLANERLQSLSYSDALTGLANRRRLFETLAARASIDGGCPLALISIDVDHFKQYNDQHGHLAGDEALRAVTDAMRACAPAGALLARPGGEEFACLIDGDDLDRARSVAECIRATVVQRAIHPAGIDGGECITISAGVASAHILSEADVRDLLHRADVALYQAKRAGRNRVA